MSKQKEVEESEWKRVRVVVEESEKTNVVEESEYKRVEWKTASTTT